MSVFLQKMKPFLKKLVAELEKTFVYASVLGTDVAGKQYQVADKTTSVSDGSWGERGFVVRVYGDNRYFEYSFNHLNGQDELSLAADIARCANELPSADIIPYPAPDEDIITRTFLGKVAAATDALTPGEIIDRLSHLNQKAHTFSPLLADCRTVLAHTRVSKIFISAKKDLAQDYTWSESYLIYVARQGEITRNAFKSFSGLKGLEILDEMDSCVEQTVSDAVKLLDAKPITPGEYDVICSPAAVGIIAHEAFGHGVELDMFVKNRANAQYYLGKEVASPMVNMWDGAASVKDQTSSYLFDDEGCLGGDTQIIENGVLRAGLSDQLSAMKLGFAPTGNGKREGFEHKAYSRMTNTFFERGQDKLADMIASISHGYLVSDATGGMEDPKDWGIQVAFNSAREILDGKLTDNYVTPVFMTGYVPDLLKAITMVSGDFEMSGSGMCGKGYKEWVKVSDGGPYIKTRARLG